METLGLAVGHPSHRQHRLCEATDVVASNGDSWIGIWPSIMQATQVAQGGRHCRRSPLMETLGLAFGHPSCRQLMLHSTTDIVA